MAKQHKLNKQYFKDLFSIFFTFFKIGLFCFGGGYAMLTLIENEVVEKHKWLSHSELADIFAIAESTPGPISINTATFIGTKHLGIFGGLIATLGVVLPSFVIISVLSIVLDKVRDNKWVDCLFRGIKIGVLILIAKAVLTFFKGIRKNLFNLALMFAGFGLVFFTDISVIYIILSAILLCTITTAFRYFYRKRFYHSVGTAPYYNKRIGRVHEKDEYVRKTPVYSPQMMQSYHDNENKSVGGDANG